MPLMHADGIYFGLPESDYHADPALGSSNLKLLLADPALYWYASPLNPDRDPEPEEPSLAAAFKFGRAVHKAVLEGIPAFKARFERETVGDDVLHTDADLRRFLEENDVDKIPTSKSGKIALALRISPSVRIADEIKRRAKDAGREILPVDEYDRVLAARERIVSHGELKTAFVGGYAEVSVFWTEDVDGLPVRCKARFDYLKPGGVGDLKSIGNLKGAPFAEACQKQIVALRYDVQAEHYLAARATVPHHIERGAVFGDVDPEFVARLAEAEAFAFQWIFFHSGEAPLVKSFTASPGNPVLGIARASIDKALRTFAHWIRTVGPDSPWLTPATVEELELAALPSWYGREPV